MAVHEKIDEKDFYSDVRILQKKTNCSNKACAAFVETFVKHAKVPKVVHFSFAFGFIFFRFAYTFCVFMVAKGNPAIV